MLTLKCHDILEVPYQPLCLCTSVPLHLCISMPHQPTVNYSHLKTFYSCMFTSYVFTNLHYTSLSLLSHLVFQKFPVMQNFIVHFYLKLLHWPTLHIPTSTDFSIVFSSTAYLLYFCFGYSKWWLYMVLYSPWLPLHLLVLLCMLRLSYIPLSYSLFLCIKETWILR